jgi:hypothetical protein
VFLVLGVLVRTPHGVQVSRLVVGVRRVVERSRAITTYYILAAGTPVPGETAGWCMSGSPTRGLAGLCRGRGRTRAQIVAVVYFRATRVRTAQLSSAMSV